MTHQDYISRSPNKKQKPYGNSEVGNRSTSLKTKLIGLITLIILAGFIGFLWSIKDAAKTQTNATESTGKSVEEKPLPKPPVEKWSYVDQLKTKEVEVGEYEVIERGPYKMQCGAFRTVRKAEALKAKIAMAGIESNIKKLTGKNGTFHVVYLGPFENKRLAEKTRHQLKKRNVTYCQISLWG